MVSCIGSDMGKAALAGQDCITNQQINSIVVDSGTEPLFVHYNLSTRREEIRAAAGGSAQPILNKSAFGRLSIVLPPSHEQRAIAHILGTLDDKIELNRKMNETLEAMARAIFKSWFVDFDPVHVKRRGDPGGRPQTGDSPNRPYMTPEILSLLPDSFQDSPIGKIPKGWRVASLGDILELAYGKALKEESRRPGPIPVFGSNGQVGWHDEKLADGPGIIVGRKGNPGVITLAPTDFFAIDTTFYVIPKDACRSLYFLFYALRDHDLASLGADSAVQASIGTWLT
jgi:type I restriction enzyme S subunit